MWEPLPVGVQHRCGVSAEERYLVWQLALLIQRNDSKGTTTRSIPIDRQILGVDLYCQYGRSSSEGKGGGWVYFDEIRIPSIATDMEVIVSVVLSRGLAENVSYKIGQVSRRAMHHEPLAQRGCQEGGMGEWPEDKKRTYDISTPERIDQP